MKKNNRDSIVIFETGDANFELFTSNKLDEKSASSILEHTAEDGELDKSLTCSNLEQVQIENNVTIEQKVESNIAFIDGQNLHLGTKENGWAIDHKRFRIYLSEKYHVNFAYYFIGYMSDKEQSLHNNLQKAGYILIFKEYSFTHKGYKKGNVDSDIIFEIMKKLVDNEQFDRAFIVSGDGDYKKLVAYLIEKSKFGKMLFPNKKFTSVLYQIMGGEYFDYLEDINTQTKIKYIK